MRVLVAMSGGVDSSVAAARVLGEGHEVTGVTLKLWGGDSDAIERSIKERLYTLNGAVQVIPGHGPATSIDRERRSNPFLQNV